MALNYLRDDNHAEKWIRLEKRRRGAHYYAEGLPVAAAAERVGLSNEELQGCAPAEASGTQALDHSLVLELSLT
jgi:hypothetical protein